MHQRSDISVASPFAHRSGFGAPDFAKRGLVLAAVILVASCSSSGAASGTDGSDAPTGDASTDTGGRACPLESGGFTACVQTCGEPNAFEAMAAQCQDGALTCPPPLTPAVNCPPGSWPSGSLKDCGPWVTGVECGTCSAVCTDGIWTCSSCLDAATALTVR